VIPFAADSPERLPWDLPVELVVDFEAIPDG
jgi:hypothetical protein